MTEEARKPGRPRQGIAKRQHIDITLSGEVIEALNLVTSNKSQFINEWLTQHPEISKHLAKVMAKPIDN